MTIPLSDMEHCPRCWAYFTKGFNHQCPPLLAALVSLHEQKKNTIEPESDPNP